MPGQPATFTLSLHKLDLKQIRSLSLNLWIEGVYKKKNQKNKKTKKQKSKTVFGIARFFLDRYKMNGQLRKEEKIALPQTKA